MGEDYSTYGGGGGSQPGTFNGVRFILVGFNPSEENEVEIKLISGGGVNVGQYGSNCTHVIVDKIVYACIIRLKFCPIFFFLNFDFSCQVKLFD